jgi:hypothetical protein
MYSSAQAHAHGKPLLRDVSVARVVLNMSLRSAATTSRLATVGNRIDKSKCVRLVCQINEWLSDNPEAVERVWDMLDTGVIWGLMQSKARTLPNSCIRVGLISKTMKMQLLKKNKELTVEVCKAMRSGDSKVFEKIFIAKYQLPNQYAIRGGVLVDSFKRFLEVQEEVVGGATDKLKWSDGGKVDWYQSGVFKFCKKGNNGVGFEVLHEAAEFEETCAIMHVASQVVVSLETLGLGKITSSHVILDNWDMQKATVSNGKRQRTQLWDDFKDDKWFDFDRRITGIFGNDTWRENFGETMANKRKESQKVASEAQVEAFSTQREAKSFGETTTPIKKRKRIT